MDNGMMKTLEHNILRMPKWTTQAFKIWYKDFELFLATKNLARFLNMVANEEVPIETKQKATATYV